MKKAKLLIIVASAIILLAASMPIDRYFAIAKSLDTFASLLKEVDKFYVDETDPDQLTKTAIDAMLESLDPYTNFIPEEEAEAFRTATTGEYAGIGAQIVSLDSGVYISMLYEGYPAHRSGMAIGDKIVKVNNEQITSVTVGKISALLKGRPKTNTEIAVLRNGNLDTLTFLVQREKISVNNVPYYGVVHDQIGYIALREFTTGAGKEVKEAVKNLKSLGAEAIILDVRDNPGGLLSEAVNVTNVFIPKNRLVVETKGKIAEWNKKYKTLNQPEDDEIPLAVLVNGESASASEIVAGVVQDYDRGILVGSQTFGKGLVQTTRPLSYNTQVKITTAKYYIPSGRCIQSEDYAATTDLEKDTTIHEFTTKSGRLVYDGSGLMPDVVLVEEAYLPITIELITEGYLFYYANEYKAKSTKARFNELTNLEYNHFVKWVMNRKLQYSTSPEYHLSVFAESAKKEQYYDDVIEQLSSLKSEIEEAKTRDLINFQSQIKKELEAEIASRYQLERGAIKRRILDDKVVLTAIEHLQNNDSYKITLTKK